jgi:hypothetical protein
MESWSDGPITPPVYLLIRVIRVIRGLRMRLRNPWLNHPTLQRTLL